MTVGPHDGASIEVLIASQLGCVARGTRFGQGDVSVVRLPPTTNGGVDGVVVFNVLLRRFGDAQAGVLDEELLLTDIVDGDSVLELDVSVDGVGASVDVVVIGPEAPGDGGLVVHEVSIEQDQLVHIEDTEAVAAAQLVSVHGYCVMFSSG